MKGKVAVAMSGGVDSSLTAYLLKKDGYDVIGVTMRLSDEGRDFSLDANEDACKLGSVSDAKKVAEQLGIPHYVADFRDIFKEKVVKYFLDEYAAGRTPNPCVVCNPQIKFGELLDWARDFGADYLATGHYARILQKPQGEYGIFMGMDKHKDQSYVLYRINRELLKYIMMPLGNYTKVMTRQLAKEYGLVVAEKTESQEICFVPDDDYKAMLKHCKPECLIPGDIVDLKGNVLGRHQGVPLYTIGQRKGLGIAYSEPLYVVKLDVGKNQVVVSGNKDVFADSLIAEDMNWLAFDRLTEPIHVNARIRYGSREGQGIVTPLNDGRVRVDFDRPQRAVTPGQSVVFYDGEQVIGGGIIKGVV
ncbi:MAG: tRNA 2-thiouridine(34) synthase MnmA [Anaerovibrio sp.]|uniref:tRNA 2-thiouridine(34) synthase MnmA n=1 Tax=Anaerovibrio sp. TaxID=1872532 RepID=UPI0025DE267C|nr:tRNA 2-thiouridine(34) synthase MnmA [Anaerovibrio sp.]MCR5175794.1 tRNA 2-thiouridine(34) synthase MnmA [Anaerovibrio sp.]